MVDAATNVYLLSIDALRADHLGCYGYHRDTSPTIDQFAEGNILFRKAYSTSSHTREAVPSLLTGYFPRECVGLNYELSADTIATSLKKADFNSGGFHSNPYVSRAFEYGSGFDEFDDDLYLGGHPLIALAQRGIDKLLNRNYASASKINKRSVRWFDGLFGGPETFLWNHYMDVHGPYQPPTEYRKFGASTVKKRETQRLYLDATSNDVSLSADDTENLIDLYDGEIAYVDDQISKFFDSLRKRGAYSDSLIIITSDHGDAFGENGYYSHPRFLDDELLQIPMIVKTPDDDSGDIDVPVSTLDVVPSILEAVNLSSGSFPGTPLQSIWKSPNQFDGRVVFSQVRGQEENENVRRFAAFDKDGSARVELESHKPLEEQMNRKLDSVESASSLYESLRQHVTENLESLRDTESGSADVAAKANVESRLEALGYKE